MRESMGRPAQAGRPFVRYNGSMERHAELLRRGDAALALPRLGGMARPDGVVIVSERFWAFAGVDGSLREGRMPQPPEVVHRLPLARGLVRLGASLSPMFRRGGVAPPRERYLILAAVLAPLGLAFLGAPVVDVGGIVALARPALHDPARPRAPPARRRAPRDRRRRGAAPRCDAGRARPGRRGSRRAAARTSRRSRCRSPSSPTACCRSRRRSGRRSSCSCSRSR